MEGIFQPLRLEAIEAGGDRLQGEVPGADCLQLLLDHLRMGMAGDKGKVNVDPRGPRELGVAAEVQVIQEPAHEEGHLPSFRLTGPSGLPRRG